MKRAAPTYARPSCCTMMLATAAASALLAAPASGQPFGGPSVTAVQVGPSFSQPLFVSAPPKPAAGQPADDRLFVVEKTGRIQILHLDTGTIEPDPFLDLSALVSTDSERGLLGLAFDPDFRDPANRFFYVDYTNLAGNTVIGRFQVSQTDPNLADPDSFTQITAFIQPFANHNGGCLQFGPDGMLYASSGDGGSGNDPQENAQNINVLLGKILRFDVNNAEGGFIPADNPFVNADGADEIWAYGLRNPFRMSFDRLTGDLYIGDVGQSAREEIDFQPANQLGTLPGQPGYQGGVNYGWRCREGTLCTGLADCTCPDPAYTDPLYDYARTNQVISTLTGGTRNVTGGYVYQGEGIPSLQGMYVWAEFGARASYIGAFTNEAGAVRHELDLTSQLRRGAGTINSIASFGEDAEGELYMVSIGGPVLKIVQAGGADCGCDCYLTGCNEPIFQDDFEAERGWTTQTDGATAGQWQRGVPIDDSAWPYDPFADADGSAGAGGGSCWLTENLNNPAYADPSNTDVDNGSVTLISPAIDMSAGGITMCYSYFLNVEGADTTGDLLRVEINTANGSGPWTPLRTHTADTNTSWFHAAITQADLDAAGVTLGSQTKVRFTAADGNPQSIVEAGVDGFAVFTSNGPGCATPCPCETDGTAGVNVFDLLSYLDLWFEGDAAAEWTNDVPASIDVFDLLGYLDCWFDASAGAPCP